MTEQASSNATTAAARRPDAPARLPLLLAAVMLAGWLGGGAFLLLQPQALQALVMVPPIWLAVGLLATLAPLAMLALMLVLFQRGQDVATEAGALRRQLSLILGTRGIATDRAQQFNSALRDQLELLQKAQQLTVSMPILGQLRASIEALQIAGRDGRADIEATLSLLREQRSVASEIELSLRGAAGNLDLKTAQTRDALARLEAVVERAADQLVSSAGQRIAEAEALSSRLHARDSDFFDQVGAAGDQYQAALTAISNQQETFASQAEKSREQAERSAAALQGQSRALEQISTTLRDRTLAAEVTLQQLIQQLQNSEQATLNRTGSLVGALERQTNALRDVINQMQQHGESISTRLGQQLTLGQGQQQALAERLDGMDRALGERMSGLGDLTRRLAEQTAAMLGALEETAGKLASSGTDLFGMLRASIAEADSKVDQQRQQTTITLETMQGWLGRLKAQADSLADTLQRGSRALEQQVELIGQHQARLRSHSEEAVAQTGAVLSGLETMVPRLEQIQARSSSAGDAMARQLSEAGSMMAREISQLEQQASQSSEQMHHQLQQLSQASSAAALHGSGAGASLSETLQLLREAGEATEAMLRQRNAEALASLQRSHQQFDDIEQTLAQRAAAAERLLGQSLSQWRESSEAGGALLTERTRALQQAAAQSAESMEQWAMRTDQQAARLQAAQQQIGSGIAGIEQQANQAVIGLRTLISRIEQLRQQSDNATQINIQRLQDAADALGQHLQLLGEQTNHVTAQLRQGSNVVAEQTTQLGDVASRTEQQARAVAAVASLLAEQVQQLRGQSDAHAARLTANLTQAGAQLETASTQLAGAADQAGQQLAQMAAALERTGTTLTPPLLGALRELQQQGEQTGNSLSALMLMVRHEESRLGEQVERLEGRDRTLRASLGDQQQAIDRLHEKLTSLHLVSDERLSQSQQRLQDTAELAQRQMLAFTDQAQATLATLRSSGNSFADQSQTLLAGAEAAEQQIRSMLAVTAALQERTGAMRSNLQGDIEQMIGALAEAVTQLEQAGLRTRSSGSQSVEQLHQAGQQLFAAATDLGQQLQAREGTLRDQAQGLRQMLQQLDEQMARRLSDLGQVQDGLLASGRDLAGTVGASITRLAAARSALDETATDGQRLIGAMAGRLEETSGQIRGDLGQFEQRTEQGILALQVGEDRLRQQITQLADFADTVRERLARAGTQLGQQTDQVAERLREFVAVAERGQQGLLLQAQQTGETLQLQGDQFRRLSDEGVQQLRQISDVVEISALQAQSAMQQLRDQSGMTAEQLTAVAGRIHDQQQELLQTSAGTDQLLASQVDRTSALRGALLGLAHDVDERLRTAYNALEARLSDTARATQDAQQMLRAAAGDVQAQTGAIVQATQRAEGQMLVAVGSMREQIDRARTSLGEQAQQAGTLLQQALAAFAGAAQAVRTQTQSAQASIEQIGSRLTEQTGATDAMLEARIGRLRDRAEEAARLLQDTGVGLGHQLQAMEQMGQTLVSLRQSGQEQGGAMLRQAHELLEKLVEAQGRTRTLSDEAANRLGAVARQVEQQMLSLADSSSSAGGLIQGAATAFQGQGQQLLANARETELQLRRLAEATEQLSQRAEQMRGALRNQGEELVGSLAQIIAQLEATGDSVQQAADAALSKADRVSKKAG